jgi:diguanylate cyclase (GGDEF)-like protein
MKSPSLQKHTQELNRYLNFQETCWWIIDIENAPDQFYCNEYMKDIFNLDKSLPYHSVSNSCPIVGDYLENVELKSPEQAQLIFAEYQALVNQEIKEYKNQFPYFDQRKNITYYFESRAKVLELNAKGEVALIYGIIENITKLELQRQTVVTQNEMLKKACETDVLTGLNNRRHFMALFKFCFFRAQREQTEIAVLMIDVDYFKLYNDSYGHLKGDQCLIVVANILTNTTSRKTDVVARFGGEEFIIFLTGVNAQETLQLADLIKNNVELCKIDHPESTVSDYVTVSIGAYIGIPSREEHEVDLFIKHADDNLYQSKALGRNRTIIN